MADSQIIYRGRITNKTFTPEDITFVVKDSMFDLNQPVPTGVYTEDEGVSKKLIGRAKRWIYGRVDGLLLQHLDLSLIHI